MAKIQLGKRPESFPAVVTFPMLDGSTAAISVKYKYRTRREFGEFIDRMFNDAGEAPPADGKFSLGSLMSKTVDKNAQYLSEVLVGWDLDEPLTLQSLAELADELPAAAAAVMEKYRTAITEGRLGN